MTGVDTILIPVGIDTQNGGEVTFSARVVPIKSYKFFLEDRLTGNFTDLSNNTYTITLPPNSYGTGRFYLHSSSIRRRSILPEKDYPNILDLRIWASDHKVIIQGTVSTKAIAVVYNMQGKKVFESHLVDETYNSLALPIDLKGVYLVQVTDLYVYSKKVVLL